MKTRRWLQAFAIVLGMAGIVVMTPPFFRLLSDLTPSRPDIPGAVGPAISTMPLTPIVGTGVAAIIFCVVVYLLYRLSRRGLSLLARGVDLDVPPIALLVSFALAATIFSSGASALWGLVYGLAELAFVEFPRAIVELSYASYTCGEPRRQFDPAAGSDCYPRVATGIANSVQRLFAKPLTYVRSVVSLVQFFAAWAVLAWVIGDLVRPGEVASTSKGFRRLIKEAPPETRFRFALGSVIAIGAYLCFCAIVAVSLFKPIGNLQLLDHKALEERLNLSKLKNEGDPKPFSLRFPDTLAPLPQSVNDPKLSAAYTELLEVWKQAREQMLVEQDRLVQRAVAGYMLENLNRVGSREQANHFLALNRWFQSGLAKQYVELDNCRAAISRVRWFASAGDLGRATQATQDVSQSTKRDLSPQRRILAPDLPPGGIGGVPMPPSPLWVDSTTVASAALSTCLSRSTDIDEPPNRSDFGYTLGFVGELSIWLLRTESMPLALITGLVGFGLFGALVSTFVRTPAGATPSLDIFGVVWRGVSAAVVVFLAAYTTSNDPNPYVVFVTCLVGAVFGDDVWRWAKKKFLPKNEEGDAQASSGGEARPRPAADVAPPA